MFTQSILYGVWWPFCCIYASYCPIGHKHFKQIIKLQWSMFYWCICIFILIYEMAFRNSIVYMRVIQVIMMLSAGYFRIRSALPGPVWTYPVSYIAFHTYSIQASLLVIAFCCILHMSSCVSFSTLWLTHLLLLNQLNMKILTIRHIQTFHFPF